MAEITDTPWQERYLREGERMFDAALALHQEPISPQAPVRPLAACPPLTPSVGQPRCRTRLQRPAP